MIDLIVGIILTFVSAALLSVVVMGIFFLLDAFMEIPYVGVKKESLETMIKLSRLKKGETIVDLGSGDGRILFKSANKGAFAVGYEINPFLLLVSKIKRSIKGLRGEVKILNKSMWLADLKVADVIFVYSLKKKTEKFERFIYKNANKGTRIIVNTNHLPNKKPVKISGKIFLYEV